MSYIPKEYIRTRAEESLLPLPSLATTLPTVTQQASSTIASGVRIAASSPLFSYQSPVYTWSSVPAYKVLGSTSGSLIDKNSIVTFWSDAPVLELYMIRYNTKFEIRVNGQFLSATQYSTDASGSTTLYNIDWAGVRIARKYEICGFNMPFGGLWVGPNDSVWYPSEDNAKPSLAFLGDSYTQGTGAPSPRQVYAGAVCDLLGYEYAGDGLGGSGWNTASPDNPSTRVANYIALLNKKPKYVITALGYNDKGGNMSTLQTSYVATVAQIRTLLPESKIITLGPWTPTGTQADLTTVKTTMQALCTANNTTYIDIDNIINTANSSVSVYGNADGVHPNNAGHKYLAYRIASLLRLNGL